MWSVQSQVTAMGPVKESGRKIPLPLLAFLRASSGDGFYFFPQRDGAPPTRWWISVRYVIIELRSCAKSSA